MPRPRALVREDGVARPVAGETSRASHRHSKPQCPRIGERVEKDLTPPPQLIDETAIRTKVRGNRWAAETGSPDLLDSLPGHAEFHFLGPARSTPKPQRGGPDGGGFISQARRRPVP